MENKYNVSGLTLRDFTRALFRQKLIIILTFVIIITGTIVGLKMRTPVYEANVKMLIKGVGHTEGLTYQAIDAFRIHLTQMEIVKSEPVIKRVVLTLKLNERNADYEVKYASELKKPLIRFFAKKEMEKLEMLDPEKRKEIELYNAIQSLKKNIDTYLIPNTDIFYITVTDYDPEMVIAIANVVSRAYTIFDQQQQLAELTLRYGNLHPTVQQLHDNIFIMDQNLSGAKLPDLEAIGTASVKIIEQAQSDGRPIGKSKLLILLIAIFVSGFIGVALAILFDMVDQTFKSPEDILSYINIPILGSIPRRRYREKPFLKDINEPTRYTVFYEDLADQIYIFMKAQNLKTIIIASPVQRELNSTIVPNLGFLFSKQLHHKTLVVDCNIKNPSYHNLFGIKLNPGLANLIEESSLDLAQKIDVDLYALSAGSSTINPNTLIEKLNINELFREIKNDYEVVLFDCTNIKNFNELIRLSQYADGVIIVVNEGRDRKLVVKSAIAPLKLNKVNIIGGVMNNRTFRIPEVIYKRI